MSNFFNFQSFTSIVGPNGSGKSNVIDAMLFVFGYRSKRLRSKKVSSLIHNSEKYPNVQSCTVSVHFQKIIDVVRHGYNLAIICSWYSYFSSSDCWSADTWDV